MISAAGIDGHVVDAELASLERQFDDAALLESELDDAVEQSFGRELPAPCELLDAS